METLSPGGRGEGEGEYESEISHLKLAPMRLCLGTHDLEAPPPLWARMPDSYRAESPEDMGSQAEPGNQEKAGDCFISLPMT